MEPYVIKQGDYLFKIAHEQNFDAMKVWQAPENADLRKRRPNPNILLPGDVLYIPDAKTREPQTFALTPNTTNTFTSSAPSVAIIVKLIGTNSTTYSSRAYTVKELPALTDLQTDGSGTATFQAPVTLDIATLSFTDTAESFSFTIAALNPIDSLSGMFQRLQNLGYIGDRLGYSDDDRAAAIALVRAGLLALKAQPTDGSDPPSASNPLPAGGDNGGLSDDGILDSATQDSLLQAYGS